MPEEDKKKRAKIVIPKPDADADAIGDESGLYGDEADIPTRLRRGGRKKAKSSEAAPGKKKVKVPGTGHRRKKKKKSRHAWRAYHSLYDLLSATGSDSIFKPLKLFGREIRFWPLFLLGIIALLALGVMYNNSSISVTEQTITIVGLPEELEGYRIVVISDMNGRRFGDSQSLLLKTINSRSYDMILCLGDMVGRGGSATPFYELLEGVKNPDKVYFICGDSDPGPFTKSPRKITGTLSQIVLEDWILGGIERGAHYVDAPIRVEVKNSALWLSPATMLNLETVSTVENWQAQTEQEEDGVMTGLEADYNTLPVTDYRYQSMQKLYDAERAMSASDIHIALAHEPPSEDFLYTSSQHSTDERYLNSPELVLAGHYCNGVWQVPFLGALYVPDKTLPRGGWFPAQNLIHGLSSVEDVQVYITGGMSSNGAVRLMPFRLFNGPEISVITLTSTLPENMLEAGA